MATIPSGTKFIGLAPNYPTVERRSASINAESEAYTMQDIADTVSAGLPPSAPKMLITEIAQSGTSEPYFTNTSIEDFSPTSFFRNDVGDYRIIFPTGTLNEKTIVTILSQAALPSATGLISVQVYWYSDQITIKTKNPATQALADDYINLARLQIQVYE